MELACSRPPYCINFTELPKTLTPALIQDKSFESTWKSKVPGLFVRHNAAQNTYVFTWNSSISASDHAAEYYKNIYFESTCELPSLKEDIEFKYENNFSFEKLFPSSQVVVYFVRPDLFINQSVTSILDKQGVLSHADWDAIEKDLPQYSVGPVKTQILDCLARNMEKVFPEFSFLSEANTHSNEVSYSPFHNSKWNIIVTCRHSNTCEYIHLVDCATVEAEETVIEKNDRYQLLAGMEITAAKIARQKLAQSHLEEIRVNGALLDYTENKGMLYFLTMDFLNNMSRVKKYEQDFTVSQVLSYVLSSI